jgi:hypothetical protein
VTSHRLLWAATLINVLLFVRVAVIFAPYYSYQGPSGADPVFYYAYARSIVVDRDVELNNEMSLRPPSSGLLYRDGRALNKYPIGVPMLSLPIFAATHAILTGLHRAGMPVATDGYSAAYALGYALSQMTFAILGMWLLSAALCRYFEPTIAALAVVVAWLGTNALFFTSVMLMMSHAAALFSTSWCAYESVTLREQVDRSSKWLRLGVSAALVVLVRYQNGLVLLVPLVVSAPILWADLSTGNVMRFLRRVSWTAAGALLMLVPQLLVWRAIFGSWLVNSYAQEFAFSWLDPHLVEVLFNPTTGLSIWLPILALGLSGCLALAWQRRDAVAFVAAVAWTANLYVNASWWAWDLVVRRATFDILLPVALGIGWGLSVVPTRWRALALIACAALVLWSAPLSVMGGLRLRADRSVFMAWRDSTATLLHLPSLNP